MTKRTHRLKELQGQVSGFKKFLDKLKKLSSKFSTIRLILFLSAILTFILLFFFVSELYSYLVSAIFILIFGLVVMKHNKIDYEIKKTLLWIKIKEENIARINIDWKNIPFNTNIFPDESHPFESDLNITGKNSLHHLVNVCASKEGALLLRNWLTEIHPQYDEIVTRQSLVNELIPLVRFRNKLLLNSLVTSKNLLDGKVLFNALKERSDLNKLKNILSALFIIIAADIVLFILFITINMPAYFAVGLLVQLAVYWFNSKHVADLFDKAISLKDELGQFSRVLEFLEVYTYADNSKLKKFCEPFLNTKVRPSQRFRQIDHAISAASIQKNPFTELLFNLVFPWDYFYAYRLEKLKREIAETLPLWLDKWYNLEALSSLANLSYLNKDYSFPLIKKDSNTEPVFFVENSGHPLIPLEQNIRNDFTFNKIGESVIITGSNMSGKSTFLKTIGLNLALAYAGGPVCASNLNTALFRIHTSIKISDSVIDGISYFYAEVKRLKQILIELKKNDDLPLFYLIDEIFRGTNNLERLIGSRSYIKALAGSKSIGLISTHDLELVNLEKESKYIFNYHFKEEVHSDKMIFDYKIHKGPCPTTNALKIMKIEGLPVEE